MSFFKQRFASTDLSGHPFYPVPVDDPGDEPIDDPRDPASPSSAATRQPPEPSSSELTTRVAVRQAAARRDGIGITTLRRAKFGLGVVSIKESIHGRWLWALLEDEELADPLAPLNAP
jgi:hypothetical protein